MSKVADGPAALQLPTADHTPATAHFRTFDGLRAIAATLIVLHHAGFTSGESFRDGRAPHGKDVGIGAEIDGRSGERAEKHGEHRPRRPPWRRSRQ